MFWPMMDNKEMLIILQQIIYIYIYIYIYTHTHMYHNTFHCSDANKHLCQNSPSCCSWFVPLQTWHFMLWWIIKCYLEVVVINSVNEFSASNMDDGKYLTSVDSVVSIHLQQIYPKSRYSNLSSTWSLYQNYKSMPKYKKKNKYIYIYIFHILMFLS